LLTYVWHCSRLMADNWGNNCACKTFAPLAPRHTGIDHDGAS
jgi:hypothetical protein